MRRSCKALKNLERKQAGLFGTIWERQKEIIGLFGNEIAVRVCMMRNQEISAHCRPVSSLGVWASAFGHQSLHSALLPRGVSRGISPWGLSPFVEHKPDSQYTQPSHRAQACEALSLSYISRQLPRNRCS